MTERCKEAFGQAEHLATLRGVADALLAAGVVEALDAVVVITPVFTVHEHVAADKMPQHGLVVRKPLLAS